MTSWIWDMYKGLCGQNGRVIRQKLSLLPKLANELLRVKIRCTKCIKEWKIPFQTPFQIVILSGLNGVIRRFHNTYSLDSLLSPEYWCDSQFLWPTYQNLRPVARVISSGQASKGDTYTEAMYALLQQPSHISKHKPLKSSCS